MNFTPSRIESWWMSCAHQLGPDDSNRFPEPIVMVDYTSLGAIVKQGTAEIFHYLHDGLGSIVGLTNAAGDMIERYTYDPYGKTFIESWISNIGGSGGAWGANTVGPRTYSSYGNPFMWTGQRYDTVSGTYQFWARTYSPILGSWLQRDSVGYVDGVNLYQYSKASPAVLVDPSGLFVSRYHEKMTKSALAGSGLSKECIEKIAKADKDQDNGAVTNSDPFKDPLNHGDNNQICPTMGRMKERLDRAKKSDCENALKLFGQVLHALQDLYSHSNYVENYDSQHGKQSKVGDIPVWQMWNADGSTNVPNGVFTGNYKWPRDDGPFPSHLTMNKDDPSSVSGGMRNQAGVSYFDLAYDTALRASKDLWDNVIPPELKNHLKNCCQQKSK